MAWEGFVVLAVFLGMVLCSEVFLRNHGLWPAVADSKLLWAMHRNQARGEDVVVILGSSRSLLGIDPEVIEQAFPNHRVVHLGIDGTSPYAVLEDLALDPGFRGLILCESGAELPLPASRETARPWVDYYHNDFGRWGNFQKRFDEWVKVGLQSRLTLVSPPMGLSSMVQEGPYRSYSHMKSTRFRPAHYRERFPPEKLADHRRQRVERARELYQAASSVDPSRYESMLIESLQPLHELLVSRGGRMVLVRMPTTGEHWVLDQQVLPREVYWDRIQPATGIPTIHFMDYPDLAGFDCPDTSHLDASDTPSFTKALCKNVRAKLGFR